MVESAMHGAGGYSFLSSQIGYLVYFSDHIEQLETDDKMRCYLIN